MNTAKVYQDSDGNDCSIWQMVRREPEWAANRIQRGERLDDTLKRVAVLAHSGGLVGLDEAQTLQAIRRLSLPFWSARGTEDDLIARAQDALSISGPPTRNPEDFFMSDRLYKFLEERDPRQLYEDGEYFVRHMSAMTSEGLHAKSDIAAELGWRDREIDRATERERALVDALRMIHSFAYDDGAHDMDPEDLLERIRAIAWDQITAHESRSTGEISDD